MKTLIWLAGPKTRHNQLTLPHSFSCPVADWPHFQKPFSFQSCHSWSRQSWTNQYYRGASVMTCAAHVFTFRKSNLASALYQFVLASDALTYLGSAKAGHDVPSKSEVFACGHLLRHVSRSTLLLSFAVVVLSPLFSRVIAIALLLRLQWCF
jgi:hypothetical protein